MAADITGLQGSEIILSRKGKSKERTKLAVAALSADSSQVTNGQGQDERRTAALDPLRPACRKVIKGRLSRPL